MAGAGTGLAFATLFTIILVANVVIVFIDPTTDPLSLLSLPNLVANLIVTVLALGILTASVLGSGLSDQFIRFLIGISFMLSLLFTVNILGLTFGLGLGSRLTALAGDPFGVWSFVINSMVLVTFILGLVTLAGSE